MTDPRPPRSGPSTRGTWIAVCLLLAPAVIVPLVVPWYDMEDPTLFDFPFYFWFQLALIPAAVLLTVVAYYLSKSADRRDHEAHGSPGRHPRGGSSR